MGWRCPVCLFENDDSVIRCICGYEEGEELKVYNHETYKPPTAQLLRATSDAACDEHRRAIRSPKLGHLSSFGVVLVTMIVCGIVGWILFPLTTAFGFGLAAAVRPRLEMDPRILALGYYRVHSASHAVLGAILCAVFGLFLGLRLRRRMG